MIIIHAAIHKNCLILWGERSFDLEDLPKQRGRKPKNPPPQDHPFALKASDLIETFQKPPFEWKLNNDQIDTFLAWLPAAGGVPAVSHPILGEQPEQVNQLAPIRLEGTVLNPKQTRQFLELCLEKPQLAPGIRVGEEALHLGKLLKFAHSLVIRQRYLPSIIEGSATWEPVLMGKDKERFAYLVKSLPRAACSISDSMKQRTPPNASPSVLLECFLSTLIDCFVKKEPTQVKTSFHSVHDEWIYCLQVNDSKISKAEQLNQQIMDWKRPLELVTRSPFRLCFRLEDPTQTQEVEHGIFANKSSWFVRYLLQAHDDPSLLVEVKDVWNPKGETKKILSRDGFNPRHYLLSSLGFASGITPQVESSLKANVPDGYDLEVQEAFDFLTHHATLFEDAGYGVILPSWWTGKRKNISANATVKNDLQGKNRVSMWDNLLIDWSIYLGNKKLNLKELMALAKLKEPLVQMNGEWVLLNQEEIQKAIAFLKKSQGKKYALNEIAQMSLGVNHDEIPIQDVVATGWVKEFLDQLQGNIDFEEFHEPKGFRGVLRPYQRRGFSWMLFLRRWGLGGCLADDMGLGKTPQTLASIQYDWEDSKKPVLLVCPTSLTGNWSKEAKKFTPDLPVVVHHGQDRKKGTVFEEEAGTQALIITSYGLLQRDLELFEKVEWRGVILDEAQNIKNASTRQAKAAYTLKSDYKVALTGTPVENNVGDLWSLMHFTNPGFLGSQKDFKEVYFKPIQYEGCEETTSRLKTITCPFILRREKTDKSIIKQSHVHLF